MANLKGKIVSILKNKTFLIGAASFMLPALALYIIFACYGVHPFGDGQILVTDLWHQYYPFLCALQEKLKAGESLLYSETIGMGINFWALIAYYCASPLNFLVAFVSKEALRDLVVILVTLKVGFSGLFFSFYLRKVFKRYDFSTVAFSAMYALCGYVLGYYWNIMWHDCVMFLPLVMLGVYSLIKEGKWLLYVFSLAICVISNYYIGFMVCIFTAIYFFTECAKTKMELKSFMKKLGHIAITSVLALALTAFMTIPAYLALQNTVSVVPKNASETEVEKTFAERVSDFGKQLVDYGEEFVEEAPDILGRFASFNMPEPKEGFPNLFSGFISVIMLGYFLTSKKIKTREKIATSVMLIVMFVSITISDIDIIWHGMHKPNMVPYRYAFMVSFAMITMAYRTYVAEFTAESINERRRIPFPFIISAAISAVVIFAAKKEAVLPTILGCAALAIVYFVVLTSIKQESKESLKKGWANVLCGIIVLEVIINTVIAVPVVRVTEYSSYYYRGEEIEQLLELVEDESSYSRTETSQEYILNDPALYGYKGVSTFTSTANYPLSQFMEKIGLCAYGRSNRYYYETTSPFTNALFSVEHIIFKNDMKNLNPYLEEAAEVWTENGKYRNVIYKNNENLPMGFMVAQTALDEDAMEGENAFEVQNTLFRKLTGLDGDLFTRIPLKSVVGSSTLKVSGTKSGKYTLTLPEDADKPTLSINFIAPDTNSVYAYIDGRDIKKVKVSDASYKAVKRTYIFPVGTYQPEERIKFTFEFEDTFGDKETMKFLVYSMNDELFKQGMEILRDEPFEITKYESTAIEGSVVAENDGIFYTSVPYEKGWTMYVDGVETEIEPLGNAFISVPLTKGEHHIVLKYSPDGFLLGVAISVLGLAVFALCVFIMRRRKSNG